MDPIKDPIWSTTMGTMRTPYTPYPLYPPLGGTDGVVEMVLLPCYEDLIMGSLPVYGVLPHYDP